MFDLLCYLVAISIAYACTGPPYTDYRGCKNKGNNNETCVNWMRIPSGWEHDYGFDRSTAAQEGIGDHDYCRNPGPMPRLGPWCFSPSISHPHVLLKVYCGINEDNCNSKEGCAGYTVPEKRTKGGKVRQPIDRIVTVEAGRQLRLPCVCEGEVEWESGPTLADTYQLRDDGALFFCSVQDTDAGIWRCTCGGDVSYSTRLTVTEPATPSTSCRQNPAEEPGETYRDTTNEEGESNEVEEMEPDEEKEDIEGKEDIEEKEDIAGVAQERKSECVNCGLCRKNPVICGVLVVCVSAMAIVLAIYIRQTFKWRRVESSLKYSLFQTLSRKSDSYVTHQQRKVKEEPHYERAADIRQNIAQYIRTAAATDNSDFPVEPRLSRILSKEIESKDDLICGAEEDHQHDREVEEEEDMMVEEEENMMEGDTTIFDKYYQAPENWSITSFGTEV